MTVTLTVWSGLLWQGSHERLANDLEVLGHPVRFYCHVDSNVDVTVIYTAGSRKRSISSEEIFSQVRAIVPEKMNVRFTGFCLVLDQQYTYDCWKIPVVLRTDLTPNHKIYPVIRQDLKAA